jgi:hypothetical protein
MITLCVAPQLVGTIAERIECTIMCLILDSIYIVPMIKSAL